jgi:predicted RNA-binding protein with TRAM domain
MTDKNIKVVSPDETDIQVGDQVRVVVQGIGNEGDPLAYIGGAMTIVHPQDDVEEPDFGDTIQVKIADARTNQYHAVYTGEE